MKSLAARRADRAVVAGDARGLALLAVHEDEIEVRRHVELVGAALAHADREQVLGPPLGVQRRAEARRELQPRLAQRLAAHRGAERAHRGAHLLDRREAADVALDQRHQQNAAQAPQRRRHGGAVRVGVELHRVAAARGLDRARDLGVDERRRDRGARPLPDQREVRFAGGASA
jgi:hypothetical protein